MKVIETRTFHECELMRVEFQKGIRSLGSDADNSDSWSELFRDCAIKVVVIPNTVREIKSTIFKQCLYIT